MKEALGGRSVRSLSEVREHVSGWVALDHSDPQRVQLLTDVHIQSALNHPSSAFALEFKDGHPAAPWAVHDLHQHGLEAWAFVA